MAPIPMKMELSANTTQTAFVATCVAGLAILTDLPEVFVLLGLWAYLTLPSHKKKELRQWLAVAKHPSAAGLVDTTLSKACALVIAAVLIIMAAGISSQIGLAIMSAVAYVAVYESGRFEKATIPKRSQAILGAASMQQALGVASCSRRPLRSHSKAAAQQSRQPVSKAGFDGEVEEFMRRAAATPKDEATVSQIAKLARRCIYSVIPEAEVKGISRGNLALIGASGAKPEVDIIVTVDPSVLTERLKAFYLKGTSRVQKSLDTLLPEYLQKTATKVLSERLSFVKFWRSQFSGCDPLIVLLVPVETGVLRYPLLMNFSVNTPYPLRLSTLLTRENAACRELITIVTAWARERCVANMSRGQPHTYAWGLLVLYFLRFGFTNSHITDTTTAKLFKEFVKFYSCWFGNPDSRVAVCFSDAFLKQPPEGTLSALPYIEDPFDAPRNAAETMTDEGVARVREELARASSLFMCEEEPKLSEMMQRWTPRPAA